LPQGTDCNGLQAGTIDAVVGCLWVHQLLPIGRIADNRKALQRIKRNADAAAAALQALGASIEELHSLFPWSYELLFKHLRIILEEETSSVRLATIRSLLQTLASVAEEHANLLKPLDRGGHPRMTPFRVLIELLAGSFKSATGHPATVTYDPHGERYGGRFIRLLEMLLPTIEALALATSGRPFNQPKTYYARGKMVQRVLRESRSRNGQNPASAETGL
jgi:hypothetical protein